MGEFSIGQSVRRREDPRLLMGRGRYFDDLKIADQFHAAILRSHEESLARLGVSRATDRHDNLPSDTRSIERPYEGLSEQRYGSRAPGSGRSG